MPILIICKNHSFPEQGVVLHKGKKTLIFSCMPFAKMQSSKKLKKNSIAFGKAPRREADSQPISQSARQSVSQASRQAHRQAETHSLAFFQLRTMIINNGEPHVFRNNQWSSGEAQGKQTSRHRVKSQPARPADRRLSRSRPSALIYTRPWFKSF